MFDGGGTGDAAAAPASLVVPPPLTEVALAVGCNPASTTDPLVPVPVSLPVALAVPPAAPLPPFVCAAPATDTTSVSLGAAMPICSHKPRYVLYIVTPSVDPDAAALHCVQTIAARVVSSAHAQVSSKHCGRVRLRTAQPPPRVRHKGPEAVKSDCARPRAEALLLVSGLVELDGEGVPEVVVAAPGIGPVAEPESISDRVTSDG